ncbi:response regulator transcription factor [Brucella pseudogrignonensis]
MLLVEDEIQMAEALRVALARYDMVVDHVTNLESAENAVDDHVHDAIVLDRQLANEDGLNLLRYLRKKSFNIPVIVVTARSAMEERVAGLDQGADDYLGKPFAVEELVARLRALLRRPPVIAPLILNVGDLVYLPGDREARVLGQTLELPRRELLVLETLMRRQGRTVLRRVLEEAVYSFDDEIQSNALDSHISRLRRKLSEAKAGVEIHGIRGVGYLLRAQP